MLFSAKVVASKDATTMPTIHPAPDGKPQAVVIVPTMLPMMISPLQLSVYFILLRLIQPITTSTIFKLMLSLYIITAGTMALEVMVLGKAVLKFMIREV